MRDRDQPAKPVADILMEWDLAQDYNDSLVLETVHIIHQTKGERSRDAGKLCDKIQFPFGMASPKGEKGRNMLSLTTVTQPGCRPGGA